MFNRIAVNWNWSHSEFHFASQFVIFWRGSALYDDRVPNFRCARLALKISFHSTQRTQRMQRQGRLCSKTMTQFFPSLAFPFLPSLYSLFSFFIALRPKASCSFPFSWKNFESAEACRWVLMHFRDKSQHINPLVFIFFAIVKSISYIPPWPTMIDKIWIIRLDRSFVAFFAFCMTFF